YRMNDQKVGTKDNIIDAAIYLFNSKGYEGTTVREIANKAKANIATISYYYSGKQGLLEECLIRFFEPYLVCLEEEVEKLEIDHPLICLQRAVKRILILQSKNHLLTRFVWREVTIDSQTSREIITTYLMKERYLLKTMIQSALKETKTALPLSMIIIQLKGMLVMPYVNSQYVQEVWGLGLQENYFIEKYNIIIRGWLESLLGKAENPYSQNEKATYIG